MDLPFDHSTTVLNSVFMVIKAIGGDGMYLFRSKNDVKHIRPKCSFLAVGLGVDVFEIDGHGLWCAL